VWFDADTCDRFSLSLIWTLCRVMSPKWRSLFNQPNQHGGRANFWSGDISIDTDSRSLKRCVVADLQKYATLLGHLYNGKQQHRRPAVSPPPFRSHDVDYEPLEQSMWIVLRRLIMTYQPTHDVWCIASKSSFANMATVRSFEVTGHRFNGDKICTCI
jgi:hypothetical protein